MNNFQNFRFSGVWPAKNTAPIILKILNPIFRVGNFTLFSLLFISVIGDIVENYNDLTIVTNDMCFIFGTGMSFSKSCCYFVQYDQIMNLINEIYSLLDVIQQSNDAGVQELLTSTARQENTTLKYFFSVLSLLALSRIMAGRKTETGLPLRAAYPFDTTESPIHQIMYFYHSYCIECSVMTILGIDILGVSFVRWSTVLLKVLSSNYQKCDSTLYRKSLLTNTKSFNNLGVSSTDEHTGTKIKTFISFEAERTNKNDNTLDCFTERFKLCIKQHQKLIEITNNLCSTLSYCMLIQVVSSTSMICMNGIQLILHMNEGSYIVKFIAGLVVAFTQLFVWCWFGNELIFTADSLTESLWLCGWENALSSNIKNSLTISMAQTLRPIELNAIGLFQFTMPTFLEVNKKIY
ncbi:GSCOCT00002632001.3-RA-CDS, partial [Cotesia congregata]